MKLKFSLSELGVWFTKLRTSKSGAFSKDKFVLYIEIDQKDLPKREKMVNFLNHLPSSINATFLGVPMLLAKQYDYFDSDDIKESIDNHAWRQATLGAALRSTLISGVQLCNCSSSAKTSTLLQDLMEVESIVQKKVVK